MSLQVRLSVLARKGAVRKRVEKTGHWFVDSPFFRRLRARGVRYTSRRRR